MPANSVTFSPCAVAVAKMVLMGPPGALHRRIVDAVCSLKETECISAGDLQRDEMTRGTPLGVVCAKAFASGRPVSDETAVAIVRRWFWSRQSTRGFVLTGFPATIAQAVTFDEWLDCRDESLTACLWLEQSQSAALAEANDCHVCPRDGSVHYPTQEAVSKDGHCGTCRSPLQPDGDRARGEIRSWFSCAARAAETVAAYYRERGNLVTVDATGPADAAFARVSNQLRLLRADR